MMPAKVHSKFNMPVLRRRAKRMMRSKYKKTIKLSDVDKIWKEYVEYAVVKRLLKFGTANVDNKMTLEIVGRKIIEDPKAFNMLVNGLNVAKSGGLKKSVIFNNNRPDVKYKIVLKDNNYKRGNLIFKADSKLSNRVHNELKNTNTYYRIENVSK